jgi:hypothetical protein
MLLRRQAHFERDFGAIKRFNLETTKPGMGLTVGTAFR